MVTYPKPPVVKRLFIDKSAAKWLVSSEWWWRAFIWVILVLGAFLMALPFLWLVSSSLKAEEKVF